MRTGAEEGMGGCEGKGREGEARRVGGRERAAGGGGGGGQRDRGRDAGLEKRMDGGWKGKTNGFGFGL